MTVYTYRARDRSGRERTGEVRATSSDQVVRSLVEQGLVPISVDAGDRGLNREIRIPGLSGRVRTRDLVLFSRQFATMVNSGLSLLKALSVLVEQTDSPTLAGILLQVKADVEQGNSLSAALARHSKVFDRLYVAMVRAGEVGGVLDETLLRLADMLEANLALRSKIRSALAYPAVVSFFILVITTAMLVFLVPIFAQMYEDLGGADVLPLPTRMLVAVSEFLTAYGLVLILLLVLALVGARRWVRTPSGRLVWDTVKLRIPVFGSLFHKTAMSRFARTFAVLSRTGVPVLQTLDIVGKTSGNARIEAALDDVADAVREGESLAGPMAHHDVFPPMVVRMIAVGEETGAMDAMLEKVADFYDREVDAMVKALTSLIEPVLIVVMGITVGAILIALYLPIFQLGSLVG